MTEPIVCHQGKCIDKNADFLDECVDCDFMEQIEHDLLKKSIKGGD